LNGKVLASAMTVGVLSAPVAIAVADDNEETNVIPTPAGEAAQIDQEQLNTVALKRHASRWEARHEAKAERKAKAKKRAKKRARKAAAQGQSAPAQQTAGGSTAPAGLQAIAACESGGNPGAVGGGGAYRGKYQFDQQTWASVGGSGDPASAPEAEQDKRAAILYSQRGASAWPVCGQ
jgi:hypothetical protein